MFFSWHLTHRVGNDIMNWNKCKSPSFECLVECLEAFFAFLPIICGIIALNVAQNDMVDLIDLCPKLYDKNDSRSFQCIIDSSWDEPVDGVDFEINYCERRTTGSSCRNQFGRRCGTTDCVAQWIMDWYALWFCTWIVVCISALSKTCLICTYSCQKYWKWCDLGLLACSVSLEYFVRSRVPQSSSGTKYVVTQMLVITILWVCYYFGKGYRYYGEFFEPTRPECAHVKPSLWGIVQSQPQLKGNNNMELQNMWDTLHAQHDDLIQRGVIRPPNPRINQSFQPSAMPSQIQYANPYNTPSPLPFNPSENSPPINPNYYPNPLPQQLSGIQSGDNPYRDAPPNYDFAFESETGQTTQGS